MKKKIFDVLNQVGVPCSLRGRLYIESAIDMVSNCNMIIPFTKTIYPEIAKTFETTPGRVERAIRHAVEVCFQNPENRFLFEVFGNTFSRGTGKLTNSEFIYGIKRYLEVNGGKE